MCHTYGHVQEDANHWLVGCSFSRACWFQGPLALKTEGFQGGIAEFLNWVNDCTSNEQWTEFVNQVWALWRCRNDCIYARVKPDFQNFNKYLKSISSKLKLASAHVERPKREDSVQLLEGGLRCFTGSWKKDWQGGLGFVFLEDGNLLGYRSAFQRVCCLLQAEARALLDAIDYAISRNYNDCIFCSDSQLLVNAIMGLQPPIHTD